MIRAETRDRGHGTGEHGFTLIEICIVALIFVVLSAGLITTFLTGRTSYMAADAYVQVQQESRRAFDTMIRELRESGAKPGNLVTVTNGNQLNFQIALGYNLTAQQPACPVDAVCWGSERDYWTGWVHYGVIGVGNNRQLVRYTDTNAAGGPPAACTPANNCRVLANYYTDPPTGTLFSYNPGPPKTVTVTLQIQYANAILPTGSMSSPALSSKVTLRN